MGLENIPCTEENTIDYTLVDSEVVKSIREQRHDFMNHIQVIWGYLQLKKPEQAARYITQLNDEFSVFSSLFKIGNSSISLFLYKYIKRAYKFGIRVDFEEEVDSQSIPLMSVGHEDMDKLSGIFEEVLHKTASQEEKVLYIDLFSEEDILYIAVSNSSLGDYEEYFDDSADDNLEEHIKQDILKLREQGISARYIADGGKIALRVGFN